MRTILLSTHGGDSIQELADTKALWNHFGGLFEIVRPRRLPPPYCMVVDESGKLKGLQDNQIGSWLYGADKHGVAIVGDVFLMKEVPGDDGYKLVGLTDEEIAGLAKRLKLNLS
jgi:hypothetical protein